MSREQRRQAVTCEHCGHIETTEEVRRRRWLHQEMGNDEPRRFCNKKCQKAAWEKKNGARRKREYRASARTNVPMAVDHRQGSGQNNSRIRAKG